VNFRDAYEFDPETYGNQGAGGLLGRLQAIMQQQSGGDPGSKYRTSAAIRPGHVCRAAGWFARIDLAKGSGANSRWLLSGQPTQHRMTANLRYASMINCFPAGAYIPYEHKVGRERSQIR